MDKNKRNSLFLLALALLLLITVSSSADTPPFSQLYKDSVSPASPDNMKLICKQWRWVPPDETAGTSGSKEVSFSSGADNLQRIVVDVLINKTVKASLLLDTGATNVYLSHPIAQKLGLTSIKDKQITQAQFADGSKRDVQYVVLESVVVEGVEAKDVAAVVFLDDSASDIGTDGLLGMSFLKNFKFEVDYSTKKLILHTK
ncbi:MAG: retropepsin-like aspartic protease [Candidatus Omnitrophota bacterium]